MVLYDIIWLWDTYGSSEIESHIWLGCFLKPYIRVSWSHGWSQRCEGLLELCETIAWCHMFIMSAGESGKFMFICLGYVGTQPREEVWARAHGLDSHGTLVEEHSHGCYWHQQLQRSVVVFGGIRWFHMSRPISRLGTTLNIFTLRWQVQIQIDALN